MKGSVLRVVDRVEQVHKELEAERAAGRRVGLVPTMGALHEGHAALIRRSAAECEVTAVTVFVNPLQFGPSEDFARYPRDPAADAETAAAAGADLLFAPAVEEMYPPGASVRVEVGGGLADVLEGEARPGHFGGVATVVAKLFAIAGPCRAYFGEKDYQQLLVVRRMATGLSFPVEVVGCPTVREADGLALSSRNAYLSLDERRAARVLWRALAAAAGEATPHRMRQVMTATVASEPQARLDYAEVAHPETLVPLAGDAEVHEARLLIAAWVGSTRLIDNLGVMR